MCTTNTLQDWFQASSLWFVSFNKHMSSCHCTLFYLPIISPHFFALQKRESELEGAGLRKLEGFMFLNHSQSIIQPVHPAVSLLPQPLSSSPANWDPPHPLLSASFTFSVPKENICTEICNRRWHQLDVVAVVGFFLSSNSLSGTVRLLAVLIFPFAPLVGCWSHYNIYLTSTTYTAFGSPSSTSPKGLLSNGTSMPTMEVGFLCLSRHSTPL